MQDRATTNPRRVTHPQANLSGVLPEPSRPTVLILYTGDRPSAVIDLFTSTTLGVLTTAGHLVADEACWASRRHDIVVFWDIGTNELEIDLLRRIRATEQGPAIVATRSPSLAQRIACMRAGAEDYVAIGRELPTVREVVERGVSALTKQNGPPPELHGPAGVLLAPERHQAFVGDELIDLTRTEFELLRTLLEHRGTTVSQQDLLSRLGGRNTANVNALQRHISALRRKLVILGAHGVIRTVRGVGYAVPARQQLRQQSAPWRAAR